MDHLRTTAIIVGGGPVGLTAALALTRASIDFILLERRKEVVVEEGSDMTILPMTMRVIDQMNLSDPLSRIWNPVSGISRIDHKGRGIGEFRVFQYLRKSTGHYPYVLSRKNLLNTLYEALPEDAQSRIFTSKTITGIHNSPDSVTVSCTDGSKYSGSFIIGADGAYSAVRTQMRNLALDSGVLSVNEVNPFTTTYQALWIRFPTERLPSCKPGSATETHGSGIATQLFVGEKTATAGIYRKLPRPTRTSTRYSEKDEAALVEEYGHLPLLERTGSDTPVCLKDAYEARLGSGLVDLEEGVLQHWSWNGRIVLVGDAAHKFTPSTGSGVNFGMIDTVVLDEVPLSIRVNVNTSGQTTVAELVAMGQLIARHMRKIPQGIVHLLRSVISARSLHYEQFQKFASAYPDADLVKSNSSHKHFIDALTDILKEFGGTIQPDTEATKGFDVCQQDVEEMLFSNRFSVLSINRVDGDMESDEDSADESRPPAHQQAAKKIRKGKKKQSKKSNRKGGPRTASDSGLENVPMESYRLLEGDDCLLYIMAVFSLRHQWLHLRRQIREAWNEVAYEDLNSAVAVGLSKIAVVLVQKTALEIFVEFPGRDSFKTIIDCVNRNVIGGRDLNLIYYDEGSVDAQELNMSYAYRDLVYFIEDFRKAGRTGKPTKALQVQLDWNPDFDILSATDEERICWRRAYTINWLYDLVNVYSAPYFEHGIAHRDHKKGKLENVDWKVKGPWEDHRCLFGLDDFAAVITSLAMQKPGAEVARKVLPHHVFQLQCILDSMTESKGWSFEGVGETHSLTAAAENFSPNRDLQMFLFATPDSNRYGYSKCLRLMVDYLLCDTYEHGWDNRHYLKTHTLSNLEKDLRKHLGRSPLADTQSASPGSRFAATNANGLWEYSPYLCGEGLAEALQLAYLASMWIWDNVGELTMMVHLYNMLVQKGYMAVRIPLYEVFLDHFKDAVFAKGIVPTSRFSESLLNRIGRHNVELCRVKRTEKIIVPKDCNVYRVDRWFHEKNNFFKRKSLLLLLADADWNASRIPDTEIALGSHLAYHRLQKARRIIDPETGNVQLEETVLVQRHVEGGFDKRELLVRMSKIRHTLDVIHAAIESKSNAWFITPREHSELTGLLGPAKEDLINDICGSFPLSGMDFMQMGIFIGTTICHFEKVLEQHGNKLFKEAYLPGAPWAFMKKAKLLNLALQGNDEECLKAMAGQMQMKFLLDYSLVYWENVEHPRERLVRKVLKTYNMETVEEFLNYFKQEFLDKLL
ncbi:FAD-dependent monooxygenase sdnN [Colletotrichum fructicola]|nr:FAD-dependent monooxygenase sdnN [Colletotrichum fructicola]